MKSQLDGLADAGISSQPTKRLAMHCQCVPVTNDAASVTSISIKLSGKQLGR
jgi:hypothetical protein